MRIRLLGAGMMALGLSLAPVVTTGARAQAQLADGEGGDGGDVSGGDGGAGLAGVLPVGSQNNAAPDTSECFAAEEECAAATDLDSDAWDWEWEDEEG